jgi:hypothetical protein
MGIDEVLTAPRAPWQNPFAERAIGSIRRECLDHLIVWNEHSLRRHLQRYLAYYHQGRTHLALDKDAPIARVTQSPRDGGRIVAVAHLGGLHHHYGGRAAWSPRACIRSPGTFRMVPAMVCLLRARTGNEGAETPTPRPSDTSALGSGPAD